MSVPQDWNGIAQERSRSWEIEVRQRQLLAQVPRRQRPRWQRWTGGRLMRIGGWLTRWGERMAESECRSAAVAGMDRSVSQPP